MGANPKQKLYKPLISHKGGITFITTALIHFQRGEIVCVWYFYLFWVFFISQKNFTEVLKNTKNWKLVSIQIKTATCWRNIDEWASV